MKDTIFKIIWLILAIFTVLSITSIQSSLSQIAKNQSSYLTTDLSQLPPPPKGQKGYTLEELQKMDLKPLQN